MKHLATPARRSAAAAAAGLGLLAGVAAGCSGSGSGGSSAFATPTARTATASVDDVNGAKASAACVAKVKTLRVSTVGVLNDAAKSAQAYLQKIHPGLKVEISTAANYDQVVTQVSADKAAGRLTDVAVTKPDLLPEFVRDLGAQQISPRLLRASYDQRFVQLGQVDGKQYGIPQQVSVPVIIYNADALAKAGVDPATLTDTDKLFAAADKIKKAGGPQAIDLPTQQQFAYWFLDDLGSSLGARPQRADGSPDFDQPAFVQAAQVLKKAATYGAQSGDPSQEGLLRFAQQKTAIVGATLAAVGPGLKTLAGLGSKAFKVGVLPFPTLPGGTQKPVAGGNVLTILSQDTCQRELATEMVVALLSPDVVAAGVQAVSYLPVDTAAQSELASFYAQYPALKQFLPLIPSLVRPAQFGGSRGGEVPQAVTDAVVKIEQGGDPAGGLAQLQTTVQGLVK